MIRFLALFFIAGCLCSFFGWAGGRGEDYWRRHQNWPRWMLQSCIRDWPIATLCAVLVLACVHPWQLQMLWWLPLFVLANGGAHSTYWDFLFGYDNFWFHGFMIGVAAFPVAIITGHWWLFALRCIVVAVWMGAWSAKLKDADTEEAVRYFVVGPTMWMIC